MSWADHAKTELAEGRDVQVRPRGNSMQPRVNSGDLVSLSPVPDASALAKDDVVLVRVHGRDFLHLIKAVRTEGESLRFQIGNNRGGINGWVGFNAIYGLAVEVVS